MILFGRNITAHDDPLSKLSVEMLYRAIHSPKPESIALIRQLRSVRQLGTQYYAQLKKRLPYIVCGTFNPPYRRTENFASTNYFIIDLDHLADKDLQPDQLKQRISPDPRVLLSFVSPSGDGLKVMFRLAKPCTDSGLFSIFYKRFATDFAQRYGIEQVIDQRTSDVTRACFLSHDPQAYYNPAADPIDLTLFVDTSSTLDIFPPDAPPTPPTATPLHSSKDLPQDVIANIKTILNGPNAQKPPKAPVFVPEQLNDIIESLQKYITDTGVIIDNVSNIQYGKKIRSRIGMRQAETNVFYGRRGFTVVNSPRTGTDADTGELVRALIQSFFDTQTA